AGRHNAPHDDHAHRRRDQGSRTRPKKIQSPLGRGQARRAQSTARRNQRSPRRQRAARLGPGHLYARWRRGCAPPPERPARLAHERLIDPALGRLVDDLQPYAESLDPDSDAARLIRVARRDFDKAKRVPADYVARANAHGSASYDAWTRARPANDFAAMRPFL